MVFPEFCNAFHFFLLFLRSLKLNDPRSIRRIDCAAIFKSYDGNLAGAVKISNFGFIFKSLVENKHISTKIVFRDVLAKLDTENDGNIYLNAFIAWIEGVSSFCFINFSALSHRQATSDASILNFS